MKRINIITGHYGSGKTNFAVNLAEHISKTKNAAVTAVDLDIVNPYFRTADFIGMSDKIEIAASTYANSNLDIPALTFDAERIISEDGYIIIDVGGDDAGATALGRYSETLSKYEDETEVIYIINRRRYLTRSPAEAAELMYDIEKASKISVSSIVNNTNLGEETTAEIIEESVGFAEEVSDITGRPLLYTTVPEEIEASVPRPFPVKIYVKKIWDK
jgi:hypothetical protein